MRNIHTLRAQDVQRLRLMRSTPVRSVLMGTIVHTDFN
jgi:hypothetical protein